MFHGEGWSLSEEREAELLAAHDREVIARRYYEGRHIAWSSLHEMGSSDDPVKVDAYGWTEHVARKQTRAWWVEGGPKFLRDLRDLGLRLPGDDDKGGTDK